MNYNKPVLFSATALCCAIISSCGEEPMEQASEPVIRLVKFLTIEAASDREPRTFPAVIDAAQSAELAFQVGGLLQELPISEAQEIEQGEVIARLDQRDFTNQLTSVRAQFDIANTEYQRALRLAEEDAIATSVLEQRESQFNVARAALDTSEKALSDSTLTAPYSGVVTSVAVRRLDTVQPGQVIASVMGAGAMKATFSLPASIIATAPNPSDSNNVFVMLDAAPGIRIPATFLEATLEADVVSQTYQISYTFTPPENLIILPGMNASVVLDASQANTSSNNYSAVPLSAVMSDGENQFVWVIDLESMLVSRRTIAIQDGIGETVTVTSGLTAGDTIVGAGASYLSEGIKVRPWGN